VAVGNVDPQAYALAQSENPTDNWYRKCQTFVRTALGYNQGVPHGGSAREMFNYSNLVGAIHTDRNPPPNVPVYFNTKGSDGHVALSDGAGNVWTTDYPNAGGIGLVSIDDLEKKWNAPYMGWGSIEGTDPLPLDYTPEQREKAQSVASKIKGGVGNVIDKLNPVDDITHALGGFFGWIQGGLIRAAFFIGGLLLLAIFALRATA
jgi:hypothetical protein